MKCYITITNIGFMATSEDNQIIDYQLFSKDKIIEKIEQIQTNKITSEEEQIINNNIKNYDEIIIETNSSKTQYNNIKQNDKIILEKQTKQGKYIRDNYQEIINIIQEKEQLDYLTDIRKLQHITYRQVTKDKIRASTKTDDVMIIETINSLEEIEDTTGKLIERLREWCTPYLPELDKIRNHELYTKIIAEETTRENIKISPLLKNTKITLDDENDITLPEEDIQIIKTYALSLNELYKSKNSMEEYIQEKIVKIAPNLNDVAGANLAAKLIAHMHGLESLAKLPSSTIQIIGAEKAMFRHLKTGENPPKHGLIYQHPSVRGSNWWVRGKIARAVAAKISIAAKKDAFTHDYDPTLKTQLDKKIEKINKDHPFQERKKKAESKKTKKDKKDKKQHKKKKNRKKKLKKGDYFY